MNMHFYYIDADNVNWAAQELQLFAGCNEAQLLHYYEPEPGLFLAESPKVITRALDAGYEPVSILAEECHLTGEARMVLDRCMERKRQIAESGGWQTEQETHLPVFIAPHEVMQSVTGYALTRGMICAMRRRKLSLARDVVQDASRIAVLENVVNPTNVGAIFRSAAALGMDAVLLTKGCADPLQRRSIRVSMGTVFQIPWTYLDSGQAACVKELGFAAAAMALRDDSILLDDPALKQEDRLAVILGTEGEGLTDAAIDASDYVVRIPMEHGVDSLNVAAASAVAFWELGNRKRLPVNP